LAPDANTKWVRVVGVARSIRMRDLAEEQTVGAYYYPYTQTTSRGFTLAIRTQPGAGDLTRAIRAEVSRIDPQLALFDIRTMDERTQLSLSSRRTSMTLAMAFAGLALFLSATGIYGVLAYLVSQRRREIGIRVALGSSGAKVVQLVVREGFVLVGAGLAAGLAGAVAMQRAIANEVYGVEPLDPMVLGLVMATLAAVSLLACVLPARRALQVDPARVLQE
jgi:ABC-type antimicrobial peptide transport system permease subunit